VNAIMRQRAVELLNWSLAVLLCGTYVGRCSAQYHLIPGKIDESMGCDPKTPARICLGSGTAHCYAPESTKVYTFGMEPKAVEVGQLDGWPLILFSAVFDGCGSGTLTDYSLLATRQGKFVNLLPRVELTNMSEYRLWSLPQVSKLPVLVTADFIWNFGNPKDPNDHGETHYGAHRYRIDAYKFDPASGKYAKAVSYATSGKYPGVGDVDEINVLDKERPLIVVKLAGK